MKTSVSLFRFQNKRDKIFYLIFVVSVVVVVGAVVVDVDAFNVSLAYAVVDSLLLLTLRFSRSSPQKYFRFPSI